MTLGVQIALSSRSDSNCDQFSALVQLAEGRIESHGRRESQRKGKKRVGYLPGISQPSQPCSMRATVCSTATNVRVPIMPHLKVESSRAFAPFHTRGRKKRRVRGLYTHRPSTIVRQDGRGQCKRPSRASSRDLGGLLEPATGPLLPSLLPGALSLWKMVPGYEFQVSLLTGLSTPRNLGLDSPSRESPEIYFN